MSSGNGTDSDEEAVLITRKVKRSAIEDSDSEDDIQNTDQGKSVDSDNDSVTKINQELTHNENSNLEYERTEPIEFEESEKVPFKYNSDIYDADGSSDDEGERYRSPEKKSDEEEALAEEVNSQQKELIDNKKKPRKKKEKVPSSTDNMREIRRESQRMLRETSCVLPYHIPKQRTLKDFLNRRKTSIPLKTTTEQLLSLGKQIEEMEKQSEEFFKSDESENDEEYTLPNNDENSCEESKVTEINDEEIIESINNDSNKQNEVDKPEVESNETKDLLENNVDEIELIKKDDTIINKNDKNDNLQDSEYSFVLKLSEDAEMLPNSENTTVKDNFNLENCPDKLLKLPESNEDPTEIPKDSEDIGFKLFLTEDTQDECENSNKNNNESMDIETLNKDNEPGWLKSALEYINDKELNENLEKEAEIDIQEVDEKKNENKMKFNKLYGLNIDLNKVPTLSGSGNGEINLNSPPKTSSISNLKERFFKHFSMDKKKKINLDPVEISVVSTEKDTDGSVSNIKQETIEAKGKQEEKWIEYIKQAQQPGAKLSRLKEHLESQLKARWKEDFDKRIQQYNMIEEEKVDDGTKSDYEADALLEDENEEEELTETETEEEEEEDDIKLVDKKRPQSAFLDDEAEVSEDEDYEGDVDENEDVEDLLGGDEFDGSKKSRKENENDSEDEEGYPPAYQPQRKGRTQKEDKFEFEDEDAQIMSPVLQLTGLEKKVQSHSDETDEMSQNESSQNLSQESVTQSGFSGISGLINKEEVNKDLSQADILGLCSGAFPSQPIGLSQLENGEKPTNSRNLSSKDSQLYFDSQSFTALSEDLQDNKHSNDTIEAGKTLNKSRILDSDDEEDVVISDNKPKKLKKVKYSDDEESDEDALHNNEEDEDEIEENLDLIDDEVEESEDEEMNDQEVEYDSEENEIEVIKDAKSYFENEAELSESEWGSEDEDEKDLDNFEREEADDENLDQDKINTELGKIHMQHVLADDKRDVRVLQELLLEDGDLHSDGNGRIRQFRWANADADDGEPTVKGSDDENSDVEEEEDDEKWRRIRHEREMFLQKQSEKLKGLGIDEDVLEDKDQDEGSFLKMGRSILQKMKTGPDPVPNTTKPKFLNGLTTLVNVKHGSFLASSSNYLSRLATITAKVGTDGNVNGPKNSRNFVFSVVSPPKPTNPEDESETKRTKKRKADEKIESIKKKVHFNNDGKENGQPRKSLFDLLAT